MGLSAQTTCTCNAGTNYMKIGKGFLIQWNAKYSGIR